MANNNYMQKFYDEEPSSDLIKNGFLIDSNFLHGVSLATLSVKNKNQANKLKKEIGEYIILNSPYLNILPNSQNYTQKILNEQLKKFIPSSPKKMLVVGLGNEEITADSFGSCCVDKLKLRKNIFAIKPNVYFNTNVFSYDIVKGVCNQIKPDLVVLIDSLGTLNIKRLACSFQFCNVGILPGGALNNLNKTISPNTLGIPCVVIGVPLMIFAKGIDGNLEKFYQDMILTPKDIEGMVTLCSNMICRAINSLYWPGLVNAVGYSGKSVSPGQRSSGPLWHSGTSGYP